MKRLRLAVLGVLAMLLTTAAPVSAITYGEPDNGEHPYVGFLIFYDAVEESWFSCSGTLLSPTVVLTAGHCVYDIGVGGEDEGHSGGTDIWVTFDETEALEGWPARNPENPYPERAAWLELADKYTRGTAYPSPDYDNFSAFPTNYDVGIVVLDDPVVMQQYGELAPLGTADELARQARNRNVSLIESVGYGIQSIQPKPMDIESRYKSTSRIVQVNGKAAQSGNLHTLNNPSPIGGRGGTCSGDSGGPLFVNNTNDIVAVVSYGFSGTCHGADYSWRVDTESSYDFILPFLD